MDLWNDLRNLWNSLSTGEQIAAILSVISIIVAILSLRKKIRPIFVQKEDDYRLVPVRDLALEAELLSATCGKIEPYVEREMLRIQFGGDLTPATPVRLLICGLSEVGKTREAIGIISRLDERKPRNVYFRQGSVVVPPLNWSPQKRRNLVLYIDDLKTDDIPQQDIRYEETFSQRLDRTLDHFIAVDATVDIILTMKTKEYMKLEAGVSEVLRKHGFSKIELDELATAEREDYIRNLVVLFRFEQVKDTSIDSLSELPVRIGKLYELLRDLRKRKERIDYEDIELLRQEAKNDLQSEISKLPNGEKQVIRILSQLKQFSIEPYLNIVVESFALGRKRLKWIARKKCRKAISNLDGEWFRVKGRRIHCHESKLLVREEDDPDIKKDLLLISRAFGLIKIPEEDIYSVLRPLAKELHKQGMYEESNRFNNRILELPDRLISDETKSQALFFKAYNYYRLGRKYWKDAKSCYEQSIIVNNHNLFAKHALSILHHKTGDSRKALKLLEEITKANEKDLLAWKTKLDIFIDIGDLLSEEAKGTYGKIEELLENGSSFSPELVFSGKLSLTGFQAKIGEILKEGGNNEKAKEHFEKVVVPQFESLVTEIPLELKELRAIAKNSYGCFLHDILGKVDEGTAQLEEAHNIFPQHTHTLHKLVTIYIRKGEENLEEKESHWKKANDYLAELLSIDDKYSQGLLSKAIIASKRTDWKKLAESVEQGKLSELEFWEKVLEVYKRYQYALEKEEEEYCSRHNSIAHHSAGWFLWTVEMEAKNFIQSKNMMIPYADTEFRKSLEIEEKFKDKDLPREVKKQILLAYDTLSSYLLMTGRFRKDPDMVKESHLFSKRAVELSQRWNIKFQSENSFNESYIGKLLFDNGEIGEAMTRFNRALAIYPNNTTALWWLKEAYIRKENYMSALKCWESYADIIRRPSMYGMLRNAAKRWMKERKIPQDMDRLLNYSKKAYESDPTGDVDPRNVSDYAYDNLKIGKINKDSAMLENGKRMFTHLIRQTLHRIDENPSNEDFYLSIIRNYCTPVWISDQKLDRDIALEIEDCARRHSTYRSANKMAGIVLQRNGACNEALPFLEKERESKDPFVLTSLMECYNALGRTGKAEEVAEELARLLTEKKD